jgi:hypothetical protein
LKSQSQSFTNQTSAENRQHLNPPNLPPEAHVIPRTHSTDTALHESDQLFTLSPNSNDGFGYAEISELYPWEMIGLGVEEPLPPLDVINEL